MIASLTEQAPRDFTNSVLSGDSEMRWWFVREEGYVVFKTDEQHSMQSTMQ